MDNPLHTHDMSEPAWKCEHCHYSLPEATATEHRILNHKLICLWIRVTELEQEVSKIFARHLLENIRVPSIKKEPKH